MSLSDIVVGEVGDLRVLPTFCNDRDSTTTKHSREVSDVLSLLVTEVECYF